MALIAMAVYHPAGVGRPKFTADCLTSLLGTVEPSRHRLVLIDNASPDPDTRPLLRQFRDEWEAAGGHCVLVLNNENRGTARAVNQGWLLRAPGQHAVKIDDDVVIHDDGWLDRLEECVARDPKIGIVGLKRKDLDESPHQPEGSPYRSTLEMLPHEPGERWLVVERVRHVMGTCQLYNSAFLDRVGYLYQMGRLYGLDDSLMAYRCPAAGFYCAFYPAVGLDHPDPGGTPYQEWKERVAGEVWEQYGVHKDWYAEGVIDPYQGPDDAGPRLTPLGERLRAEGRLRADDLRAVGLWRPAADPAPTPGEE